MHLLILACSAKKSATLGKIPALERYQGVLYAVLRKNAREFPNLTSNILVYIISAKFGLISGEALIENYDLKMTSKIAKAQRDENTKRLMALLQEQPQIEDITLVMGKTYLESIDYSQCLLPTQIIQDSIGYMQQKFKHYLLTLEG